MQPYGSNLPARILDGLKIEIKARLGLRPPPAWAGSASAQLFYPDEEGFMNIHEYQAKQVLSEFDVPVPRGAVAFTPDEAVKVMQTAGRSGL